MGKGHYKIKNMKEGDMKKAKDEEQGSSVHHNPEQERLERIIISIALKLHSKMHGNLPKLTV